MFAMTSDSIQKEDGDIGHVEALLVDDATWAITHLIVATSNWWSRRRVRIAPQRITEVSWSASRVSVDLTRQAVKNAPPYDSAAQLVRQPARRVDEHHAALAGGRPKPTG